MVIMILGKVQKIQKTHKIIILLG